MNENEAYVLYYRRWNIDAIVLAVLKAIGEEWEHILENKVWVEVQRWDLAYMENEKE